MSQHLITTKADVESCPRCRRTILVGIAEGLRAIADLTPLTHEADLVAVGIPTYNLRAGELHYREPGMSFPVGSPQTPTVLATHICPTKPQGSLF